MDSAKINEELEKVLPCNCPNGQTCDCPNGQTCPADFRPAVSALIERLVAEARREAGTFTWALEQMKEGKRVINPDRDVEGGFLCYGWSSRLRQECFLDCEGKPAQFDLVDFERIDWEVLASEAGKEQERI